MTPVDLKITGRCDDAFAAGASPTIERLAKQARDIKIDMSEAVDMDAAGLYALVHLHKRLEPQGFKVRVLGANEKLQRLFERFHIADLFIEGAAAANSVIRTCFFGICAPVIQPARVCAVAAVPQAVIREALPDTRRLPANAVAFDATNRNVKAWLDTATMAGSQLRGGDALKSYRRWPERLTKDIDSAQLRKILAGILGAERIVARTSGYIVQGLQLRTAMPARVQQAA